AFLGRLAAGLIPILVLLIVIDVLLRSLFDLTAVWVIEVEWHLFSVIFLLGAPYALQKNRHVRVDLFYEKFKGKDRAQVDFWGALIFLIPWSILILITSIPYAREAWITGEGSPNPGGLPLFGPIKTIIPFTALLLLLQGLANCIRAYKKWRSGEIKAEEA
ncbi:MAG: TRAP transporter small permease subunit, partial [Bacteroidota bacterium]